jgi:predicted ATPase
LGYRDEEASKMASFRDQLLLPETESVVDDIPVSDLGLGILNNFLSDVLSSDLATTLELAEVVLRKTHGNPHFVVQFLGMLQHKALLVFSIAETRWNWSVDRILGETEISDNLVSVITMQMESLPLQVRRLLSLAACLGFLFDLDLLESLAQTGVVLTDQDHPSFFMQPDSSQAPADEGTKHHVDGLSQFQAAVDIAEYESLIERQGSDKKLFKFAHDRVQECAYELLPEGKAIRTKVHLRIGTHIRDAHASKASDRFIFLAADQLNRGSSLIGGDDEARRSLIRLNLEASLAAKKKSAVELAADFLRKAIELVREDYDWRGSYECLLEVYTVSAEIEFSLGRFDESTKSIDIVIARSRNANDATGVRMVKAQTYGVQRMFPRAIQESRKALVALGERLPASLKVNLLVELIQTKRAVARKSDDFFDRLEPMTEPRTISAMRILQAASVVRIARV